MLLLLSENLRSHALVIPIWYANRGCCFAGLSIQHEIHFGKLFWKKRISAWGRGEDGGNKSLGTFVHYLKRPLFSLSLLLSNSISKRQDFFC